MSDIKMGEVFELPVRTENKYSCRQFIWSDMGLAGSYGEFNNKRQSDAACHAINNHDRLVEENAELVDMLNFLACTSDMSDSVFTAVNDLIQKHKDQPWKTIAHA